MTAALSPAGVRVDRRVMRLAALFVQPDGCYAGLPEKRCACFVSVVQSFNATQRPKSSEGISGRLSSSKPRESASANCSVAEGQPRESGRAISEMGEGKPGQARREKTCVAGGKQGEAPANATRVAGARWVQPAQKRAWRPCSPAAQEVWIDRGSVFGTLEFSGWLLRDMRTARPRNEELIKAIRRSLPRHRLGSWVALSSVQHHARQRKGYGNSVACWGGLS